MFSYSGQFYKAVLPKIFLIRLFAFSYPEGNLSVKPQCVYTEHSYREGFLIERGSYREV